MNIKQRGEIARKRGDKFFDIGVPCVRGHTEGRYTFYKSYPCVICHRLTCYKASMAFVKRNLSDPVFREKMRASSQRQWEKKKARKQGHPNGPCSTPVGS